MARRCARLCKLKEDGRMRGARHLCWMTMASFNFGLSVFYHMFWDLGTFRSIKLESDKL